VAIDCLGWVGGCGWSVFHEIREILILCFCWLVGAFSVFGRADTGKPVQIWWIFWYFEVFLEFKGLI